MFIKINNLRYLKCFASPTLKISFIYPSHTLPIRAYCELDLLLIYCRDITNIKPTYNQYKTNIILTYRLGIILVLSWLYVGFILILHLFQVRFSCKTYQ
jgi:hypothetical protein